MPKLPRNMFPSDFRPPTTSSFILSNFSFYNFSSSMIVCLMPLKVGSISSIFLASSTASSYSSSSFRIVIRWKRGLMYASSSSIAFPNSSFARFKALSLLAFLFLFFYMLLMKGFSSADCAGSAAAAAFSSAVGSCRRIKTMPRLLWSIAFCLGSVGGHCAIAKLYLSIAPCKSSALYRAFPSSLVFRASSRFYSTHGSTMLSS